MTAAQLCNAKVYKLHIETAGCGVPIPPSQTSAQRVDGLYDLMDVGYYCFEPQEYKHDLGLAPPLDRNPRQGSKEEFGGRHVAVPGAQPSNVWDISAQFGSSDACSSIANISRVNLQAVS